MDFKLFLGISSAILMVIAYIPYLKDLFSYKTKPHMFTWLIWGITQGTATAAVILNGGGFGSIAFVVGTALVFVVFLLSFRYGTKNVIKKDFIILFFALSAIFIWWFTKNPLFSVILVSLIDGIGYIPTLRKTYEDPSTETPIFWFMMFLTALLSIIALSNYSLVNMLYMLTLMTLNLVMFALILYRNKVTSSQ